MSDLFLYVVTVLIWGSTWFAITLQLGVVPPAVSVTWRFLLAAAILLGYALLRGLPLRFGWREHLWMALQGLLLFCLNYVGFYVSEQYLASGLVAVICSMLTIGNIIGMRMFFGVHTHALNLLGALLGIVGVDRAVLAGAAGPVGYQHALPRAWPGRSAQPSAPRSATWSRPATSASSCRCCRSMAGRCSTAR